MPYPVIWAPLAKDEFIEVLRYLETSFGSEVAADCVIRVDEVVDKIAIYPRMYPAFGPFALRKAVVHSHLSIFYRFENEQVDILKVWDNRQDPSRLRL